MFGRVDVGHSSLEHSNYKQIQTPSNPFIPIIPIINSNKCIQCDHHPSLILLLGLLLFLGDLLLGLLKLKGIGVKLIDIEVMLLSQEAIGGNLEQLHGLLLIILYIP